MKNNKLIATLLVATLCLSGCDGIKNKFSKEEVTTQAYIDLTPYMEVTPITTYEKGAIVNVSDIITLSEEVAGMVVQSIFINELGQPFQTLPTDEAGVKTVSIVFETSDGGTTSKNYTYEILDGLPLPENMYAALTNKEIRKKLVMKGSLSAYGKEFNILEDGEDNATILLDNKGSSYYFYNIGSEYDEDYIKYSYCMKTIESLLSSDFRQRYNDLIAGMTDDNKELFISNLYRSISSLLSVQINEYDSYLVSIDGDKVTFREYAITMDLNNFGNDGRVIVDYTNIADVEDGDKFLIVKYPLEQGEPVLKEDVLNLLVGGSPNNQDIFTIENLISIEGCQQVIKDYVATISNNGIVEIDKLTKLFTWKTETVSAEEIDSFIMFGDYTTFGDNEPEVEEPETELENPIEVIKPNYAQRFPEIYKWPENDTKYRRWYYLLENGDYSGTIIKPDGTIEEGDVPIEPDQDKFETKDGYGIIPGTKLKIGDVEFGDNPKPESYVLSTNTGSQRIQSSNVTNIKFDTANSSSSRLVTSVKDNKYYFETVKQSSIINYMNNCLYSTNDFQNGKFTVQEKSSEAVKTDKGTITPYEIHYTNIKGESITRPYMSVYTINGKYIVAYSDNLIIDGSVFQALLQNMIIE